MIHLAPSGGKNKLGFDTDRNKRCVLRGTCVREEMEQFLITCHDAKIIARDTLYNLFSAFTGKYFGAIHNNRV